MAIILTQPHVDKRYICTCKTLRTWGNQQLSTCIRRCEHTYNIQYEAVGENVLHSVLCLSPEVLSPSNPLPLPLLLPLSLLLLHVMWPHHSGWAPLWRTAEPSSGEALTHMKEMKRHMYIRRCRHQHTYHGMCVYIASVSSRNMVSGRQDCIGGEHKTNDVCAHTAYMYMASGGRYYSRGGKFPSPPPPPPQPPKETLQLYTKLPLVLFIVTLMYVHVLTCTYIYQPYSLGSPIGTDLVAHADMYIHTHPLVHSFWGVCHSADLIHIGTMYARPFVCE